MTDDRKPLSLIAQLNYAVDSLSLYRAELARVLGLKCDDVADSAKLDDLLNNNAELRLKAERFVYFFELWEKLPEPNENRLNWFRKHHSQLKTSPFYALVDQGKLEEVISLLQ